MDCGSKDFECGICLEELKDPRALPCLHTYCLACLQRLLADSSCGGGGGGAGRSAGAIRCPNCRAVHQGCLPARLPRNFHLLHFMGRRCETPPAPSPAAVASAAASAAGDSRRRLLALCADFCEQLAAADDAERACQAARRRLFDLVERRTAGLLEEAAARRDLLAVRKRLAEGLARRAAELEERAAAPRPNAAAASALSADLRRLQADLAASAEALQLPFVFNGGGGGRGGQLDVGRTVDTVAAALDCLRLCTPLAPGLSMFAFPPPPPP